MRFLVTNDDGIGSVFLHELVRALLANGHEVFLVAPKREQSWVGAAKSRTRAVHCERFECRAGSADPAVSAAYPHLGCPTWVVDGTPSDAVNIALAHLLPASTGIDAVISGINIGLNASIGFIIASGTVAGAWEGALHGLPAISLSQDLAVGMYDELKAAGGVPNPQLHAIIKVSAAHAARLAPELTAATAPRSFVVHNLNFPLPCRPDTPVKRTVPAQVAMPGLFSPAADDGTHRLVFRQGDDLSPPQPLTDRAALAQGFISHTVLDYRKLGT